MAYIAGSFYLPNLLNDHLNSYYINENQQDFATPVEYCIHELSIRVEALVYTILCAVAVAVCIVPNLIMLNIRIFSEHSLFSRAMWKSNIAFIKVIIIGVGGCFGAIIWPRFIYHTLQASIALRYAIAQVLVEIPRDFDTLTTVHLRIQVTHLLERAIRLQNWRDELAQELSNFLEQAVPVNLAIEESAADVNLFSFSYDIFKVALQAVLARHYLPTEVQRAMQNLPLPTVVEAIGDGERQAPDYTQQQQFHDIFYQHLQTTKMALINECVYTQEDISSILDESYQAMIQRSTFAIIQKASKSGDTLILSHPLLNNTLLLTVNNSNDLFKIYDQFCSVYELTKNMIESEHIVLQQLLNHTMNLNLEIIKKEFCKTIKTHFTTLSAKSQQIFMNSILLDISKTRKLDKINPINSINYEDFIKIKLDGFFHLSVSINCCNYKKKVLNNIPLKIRNVINVINIFNKISVIAIDTIENKILNCHTTNPVQGKRILNLFYSNM